MAKIKPNYGLMYEAIDTGMFIDKIHGNKQNCADLLAVTKTSFGFHYRDTIKGWGDWDWAYQFDLIREKVKDEFIELCLAEMDQ